VCKTVAKLLAGSFFSDSTEIRCPHRIPRYQTTCSLLSSFDTPRTQRYPREIANPDSRVRRCRATSLSCVDRTGKQCDGGECPVELLEWSEMTRGSRGERGGGEGRKGRAQSIKSLFLSRSLSGLDATKCSRRVPSAARRFPYFRPPFLARARCYS